MSACRRVYDSRHVQADCQEPGSAPEPYARQSSMGYLYLFAISKKSAEYLNIKKKTFAFNKTVTVQPTYSTTPAKYYKQERNQFFQCCS